MILSTCRILFLFPTLRPKPAEVLLDSTILVVEDIQFIVFPFGINRVAFLQWGNNQMDSTQRQQNLLYPLFEYQFVFCLGNFNSLPSSLPVFLPLFLLVFSFLPFFLFRFFSLLFIVPFPISFIHPFFFDSSCVFSPDLRKVESSFFLCEIKCKNKVPSVIIATQRRQSSSLL